MVTTTIVRSRKPRWRTRTQISGPSGFPVGRRGGPGGRRIPLGEERPALGRSGRSTTCQFVWGWRPETGLPTGNPEGPNFTQHQLVGQRGGLLRMRPSRSLLTAGLALGVSIPGKSEDGAAGGLEVGRAVAGTAGTVWGGAAGHDGLLPVVRGFPGVVSSVVKGAPEVTARAEWRAGVTSTG